MIRYSGGGGKRMKRVGGGVKKAEHETILCKS